MTDWLKLRLGADAVQRLLPHRRPFLLVDVVDLGGLARVLIERLLEGCPTAGLRVRSHSADDRGNRDLYGRAGDTRVDAELRGDVVDGDEADEAVEVGHCATPCSGGAPAGAPVV